MGSSIGAPASTPNNQDLLVWSLYTLGGAERWVDVEDVFLRCFELAPLRLAWRTRPDLPDYKKCAKALQSVEATTHRGLLAKQGRYLRRLTDAGTAWCEQHATTLADLYGGTRPVRAASTSSDERLLRELRSHPAFKSWQASEDLPEVWDLADALKCSVSSPPAVWDQRLDELEQAARRAADDDVLGFAGAVRAARRSA